jgi:uncharacterized protein YjiS (DUF1127 family)
MPANALNTGSPGRVTFSPNGNWLKEGRSLFASLARCLERSKSRQALAELDPDQLVDIGLSEAEAAREIAKRFWE